MKKLNKVVNKVKEVATRFMVEEDGMGTVEMALLIVVLIALVVIFKDQIEGFVETITGQFTSKSSSIF